MKNFWTSFSVTKLVFLIMTLVLSFQTIYYTLNWTETSLFNNAMLMIVSFYFWQKVGKSQSDPLVDKQDEWDYLQWDSWDSIDLFDKEVKDNGQN